MSLSQITFRERLFPRTLVGAPRRFPPSSAFPGPRDSSPPSPAPPSPPRERGRGTRGAGLRENVGESGHSWTGKRGYCRKEGKEALVSPTPFRRIGHFGIFSTASEIICDAWWCLRYLPMPKGCHRERRVSSPTVHETLSRT